MAIKVLWKCLNILNYLFFEFVLRFHGYYDFVVSKRDEKKHNNNNEKYFRSTASESYSCSV